MDVQPFINDEPLESYRSEVPSERNISAQNPEHNSQNVSGLAPAGLDYSVRPTSESAMRLKQMIFDSNQNSFGNDYSLEQSKSANVNFSQFAISKNESSFKQQSNLNKSAILKEEDSRDASLLALKNQNFIKFDKGRSSLDINFKSPFEDKVFN